jgi:hypothetical protein
MPKGVMLVFSRPSSPEREDEYNKWYDEVHIPECCTIPGVISAVRYRRSEANAPSDDAFPYLAIYELESDDLGGTVKDLMAANQDGRITMSDALSMKPFPKTELFELRD